MRPSGAPPSRLLAAPKVDRRYPGSRWGVRSVPSSARTDVRSAARMFHVKRSPGKLLARGRLVCQDLHGSASGAMPGIALRGSFDRGGRSGGAPPTRIQPHRRARRAAPPSCGVLDFAGALVRRRWPSAVAPPLDGPALVTRAVPHRWRERHDRIDRGMRTGAIVARRREARCLGRAGRAMRRHRRASTARLEASCPAGGGPI
jgi:hypothetical protein